MNIYIATVTEVDHARALVRAQYLGTLTGWIAVAQRANANVRAYTPPAVGEQVILLELDGGYKCAIASFFNAHSPAVGSESDIKIYSDGGSIEYNYKTSTLTITTPQQVTINTSSATINAKSTQVNCPTTTISGNVSIGGTLSVAGSAQINGASIASGAIEAASISAGGCELKGGAIFDAKGNLTTHSHVDAGERI